MSKHKYHRLEDVPEDVFLRAFTNPYFDWHSEPEGPQMRIEDVDSETLARAFTNPQDFTVR